MYQPERTTRTSLPGRLRSRSEPGQARSCDQHRVSALFGQWEEEAPTFNYARDLNPSWRVRSGARGRGGIAQLGTDDCAGTVGSPFDISLELSISPSLSGTGGKGVLFPSQANQALSFRYDSRYSASLVHSKLSNELAPEGRDDCFGSKRECPAVSGFSNDQPPLSSLTKSGRPLAASSGRVSIQTTGVCPRNKFPVMPCPFSPQRSGNSAARYCGYACGVLTSCVNSTESSRHPTFNCALQTSSSASATLKFP